MRSDFRGFVIGVLVIVGGAIGLIYVVVDALKDKPGALAIVIFLLLLPTSAWAISSAVQLARRHPGSEPPRHDVIDVTPQAPQLPEPRWYQSTPSTLMRTDRIDSEAHRVAQVLRDANAPPTRDALQAHAGVYGHEQARAIIGKWASWGWVTQPRQGVPARWVQQGEDE